MYYYNIMHYYYAGERYFGSIIMIVKTSVLSKLLLGGGKGTVHSVCVFLWLHPFHIWPFATPFSSQTKIHLNKTPASAAQPKAITYVTHTAWDGRETIMYYSVSSLVPRCEREE